MFKKTFLMMQACGALTFSCIAFAEATTDDGTIELQALEVQGRALSYYKEDETNLVTKTETSIDNTPQSVQVVTETLMEDQAARQITDLYRSISGMSQNNVSTVTLRGFSQDEILYDGLKGDPFGSFSIPQLFTIEQVQVLKGPSGAVYGAGEPGGVINYVTKKPTYEQQNTLQVTAGNKDFLSGSIESSGPANEDASQRYRVGLYSDGQDSYRNNVEEENQIIDLGYAWDIDQDNSLTVQYTDIHQYISGARLRGIPTDDDGNFLADTSWNNNEKSDYQELDAQVFQARLDHSINDWLESNVALRYFENTETQKYHEVVGLLDTDSDGVMDTTQRQYRDQVRTRQGITLAGNLIAELGDHTVLFGSDYLHEENSFLYYRASKTADGVSNLSLTDPVYGQDDVSDYTMHLKTDEATTSDRLGVYAQDQWQITDKLNLLSGIRIDRFEESYQDHTSSDGEKQYNDTGYSTRIGASYHVNETWKPYASISTGFVPQDAEDQQDSVGGPFDPEESRQLEVGVRSYWLNNKLNINLAAYRIIRENILQEDPNDSDLLVAIGKVRSKGVELDVMADITPRWVANVSYAYNDTVVKDANDGIQYADGDRFANTPYHQLGAWTRYDFPAIQSSIALGSDYVSGQINRQGQKVKPYTVYDLSWQTHWQDWKFQVNVKNLFDKEYAVSGFTEKIGSFVGERRRVYVSAAYDF
ncbi:TonB-dependent siderophore receptor [Marinomonas posidonica]|uniref:TonB-dependent siderophore receptor n=1 Tax=Marinomonas posidonica (strain CECT 7376 / NCIMB 14433 / IVIA-Po-181) TaxID=491952 RepID=F6CUW3_MARPP|nr:TonB-dependent receptor [Marinomonas posidonica]AEF55289.1 TonB-dependent siderophore receptor [Marinomonas posidonica IVIA-Po-181]